MSDTSTNSVNLHKSQDGVQQLPPPPSTTGSMDDGKKVEPLTQIPNDGEIDGLLKTDDKKSGWLANMSPEKKAMLKKGRDWRRNSLRHYCFIRCCDPSHRKNCRLP